MKKLFLFLAPTPAKILMTAGFLSLLAFTCSAQYVRPGSESSSSPSPSATTLPPNFWDNVSVGGSFQAQFGAYTFLGLEPLINYHFNSSVILGIGPIYEYTSIQDPYYGYYKSSIYGGRVSGMAFLPGELSRVFIMGEFDIINVPEVELTWYGYYIQTRGNLEIPLLGLGYKEPVSQKLFFTIYALWSFNNSIYSPYTNPLINAGFDIGI